MDDESGGFWASVGPQYDGTYNVPAAGQLPNNPVDVGGGSPGNYSQAILDVFKIGVGAWTATENNKAMLDYRKYEATNGGLQMQGVPVGVRNAGNQSGGLVMMIALGFAGVVAWKLLK